MGKDDQFVNCNFDPMAAADEMETILNTWMSLLTSPDPASEFSCEEDIHLFLGNFSSINKVTSGDTPLLRAIRYNYPIDKVKLLLNHGANVNCTDTQGYTPLQLALVNRRKGDYINLLLEKGAHINNSHNLFCFALRCYYSEEIIQRLLDEGCHQSVCKEHGSVLHCVIYNSRPAWGPFVFRNILQMLIEKRANVNAIGIFGESVLCFSLQKSRDSIPACDIEALIAAGSVLNCTQHTNPLLCATSCRGMRLKADVVQLLLDRGACMNFEVLKCALMNCYNDTKTIQLLLEHLQIVDIKTVKDESNGTLLHLAVRGYAVTPNVLKFLIKRGVPVNVVNKLGNTALHEVVTHNRYKAASVVKTLLECGSDVNALNKSFDTPLYLAISHSWDPGTIKFLFAYGAQIGGHRSSFLKNHLDKFHGVQENFLGCYKELVKHYLVEFGCHSFQDLIQGNRNNSETLLTFGSNCIHELREKSSLIIAEGRTLRDFLKGKPLFQKGHGIVCERAFFNQLLRILAKNNFPMYFDNICAKVGRPPMEIKLQELQLYAVKYCDGAPTKKNVVLNNDTLYNIATFLTDEDLLRFLCASYKTNDHFFAGESSKAKIHGNKRSYEQSELCRKHPKLHL